MAFEFGGTVLAIFRPLGAGEPGRSVAAGAGGARDDVVALRIGAALTVVQRAQCERAVQAAAEMAEHSLLAGARGEDGTPVGTGQPVAHARPSVATRAGRGIVGAVGVGEAVRGVGAALPVLLDADAAVAVGVYRLAGAHDDGGGRGRGGDLGVQERLGLAEGVGSVQDEQVLRGLRAGRQAQRRVQRL
jgi:hypothetical protein